MIAASRQTENRCCPAEQVYPSFVDLGDTLKKGKDDEQMPGRYDDDGFRVQGCRHIFIEASDVTEQGETTLRK